MSTPLPVLDPARDAASADINRRFELLRAGLDLINQGISLFDADLRLVMWNKPFLTLLEFPEELARVGTPFEAFLRYNAERGEYGPGDVEELMAARLKLARAFQPHSLERPRRNGRIIAVRGEPLPNKGLVTLYTDVTEQRNYEQLIREQNLTLEQRVRERTAELEAANAANAETASARQRSEERPRLITDSVPASITYFDQDLVYRFVNKRFADWIGCEQQAIIGRQIEEVVGAKVFSVARGNIEEALQGREVSFEYSLERADGRTLFARSTLVPELDADGKVIGAFSLSLDVTEQKLTQAALMEAQKMEAVGQLTGGLAHDFNNMLTVVIGNLVALEEQHGELAEIREFVEPALQAASGSVEIIKRLLAFSRQQPLEPRPVGVTSLVLNTIRLMRRSLPANIQIMTFARDEPLVALVDPHQLQSALLNLALNARDAIPGSGQLRIESSALKLSPESAAEFEVSPGEYVSIAVTDTGIGMDSNVVFRAFEPFFTTKPFGSGSGLGLAMVYGFAKQSGGSARIRSQPGAGTTVTLLLPGASDDEPALEPVQPGGPSGSTGKRLVLLVEDDPEVRRVIRLQLTDLGYPVLEADNGAEAATIIKNVPEIGILVSDLMMPGDMDGRALASIARSIRPNMRVVLISGYADTSDVHKTDIPILRKPFTKTELAARIKAKE
jgi:PAS domain S-box-containing protein